MLGVSEEDGKLSLYKFNFSIFLSLNRNIALCVYKAVNKMWATEDFITDF